MKSTKNLTTTLEDENRDKFISKNNDWSHLTRMGNHRTRLQISFLPHNIDRSKVNSRHFPTAPGPATYQRDKDFDRILFVNQPRVRIRPLIAPTIQRQDKSNDDKTVEKTFRPFWTTIGTRTQNSRLPNAPISTIHQRWNSIEKTKMNPGPAMYSIVNGAKCSTRSTTIAPKYREQRLSIVGPGPAMIDRDSIDRGYKTLLRKSPAFSMSSRWSPYSHTYTAECSDDI